MKLEDLYKRCLNANYTHVINDGDYAIEKDGNTLYLLFQWSHSYFDWVSNFDFPAKPYKDMGTKWYCHRGFLRVWKSIEPYIKNYVMDATVTDVVIVGYSHGAAIATLAHEYVWFNRPDLRDHMAGYGFGCPRCFWGRMKAELKQRWEKFYPVRNLNDIVTHLPPRCFGFRDVHDVLKVGEKDQFDIRASRLKCIDAHRQPNYILSLHKYDEIVNNK